MGIILINFALKDLNEEAFHNPVRRYSEVFKSKKDDVSPGYILFYFGLYFISLV